MTTGPSTALASRPTTRPAATSRPTTVRPWTAQSARPTTARPQTAASVRNEGSYVIALVEGRGIGREVGMAAIDKDTGRVMLVQLADCQTYVKTLHQMHLHTPSLVIIPDTFLGGQSNRFHAATPASLLVEFIQEEFPGVPLETIVEFVQQLCVEDDERTGTLLAVSNKYYALSACSALFQYAETKLNTHFAASSLRIRYVPVDGTMMIDPETARNLELVGNMSSKKSVHSLFGTLNHTYTAMASRLLRVNLLSPRFTRAAYQSVSELVQSEDLFTNVRAALKSMHKMDFDKLIVMFHRCSIFRNVVRGLPLLHDALEDSKSQLLMIIRQMLSDARLTNIERLICTSLNEDSAPSKYGIGAVNAKVYAVKANYNRLLDVARETYKENVGDIYSLCSTLSDAHSLPLTLMYQESGFVFCIKKTDLDECGGQLPKGFINPTLKKGKWQFSSMDLKKMNARMKDALDETLILSDKIIRELVSDILVDIGALYKSSEAVALIDMLWSFAHASIIRPEFTGTLAVKAGRHPILETLQSTANLVPNDVYCDDSSAFQVIQGPNTYLRQVGLLTVMAMCGCFVPAEYASFRIHDSLLTRLSNDDDVEKNLSTFASEMATSAMILGLATPRSLILIDELGRGTSPREGVGISHAIAEALIEQKIFMRFHRHFNELSTTLKKQPSVVNLVSTGLQRSRPTEANFGMTFQYKIIDGALDEVTHYGLELARLADLPADVLAEGKRVATNLAALHARNEGGSESAKVALRRKALLRLRTQLTQALDHSALPDDDLLEYIGRFQKDIARAFLHT
ncbi:muts domain V-domain-containing protein [Mycena floridula]|nr:muts domain V-domain-containing protein [Mycena floridula]